MSRVGDSRQVTKPCPDSLMGDFDKIDKRVKMEKLKKKSKTSQKVMTTKTLTVSQWRTAKIKLPKRPSSGILQFRVVY